MLYIDTDTRTKFLDSADELKAWVTNRDGDVDHGAFRDACLDVALKVHLGTGLRLPAGLPEGLPTLDWACSLARTDHATSIAVRWRRLPGALLILQNLNFSA